MKPRWMRTFYARYGVWPIAGGAGEEEPPGPEGEDEDPEPDADPDPDEPDEEGDDDEPDPRIKELSDEAARYRVRAKKATTRADTAEEALRATRVELAVRREAAARDKPFADLDVVLQLVDVAVDEEGQPVEVAAALDHLADRHPYLLADEQPTTTRVDPSLDAPSGTSVNRDKNRGGGIDMAKLRRKYPALRRGR